MKWFISAFCLGFPELGREGKQGCALDPRGAQIIPRLKSRVRTQNGSALPCSLGLCCLGGAVSAPEPAVPWRQKPDVNAQSDGPPLKGRGNAHPRDGTVSWIPIPGEAESRRDYIPSLCRIPTQTRRESSVGWYYKGGFLSFFSLFVLFFSPQDSLLACYQQLNCILYSARAVCVLK